MVPGIAIEQLSLYARAPSVGVVQSDLYIIGGPRKAEGVARNCAARRQSGCK